MYFSNCKCAAKADSTDFTRCVLELLEDCKMTGKIKRLPNLFLNDRQNIYSTKAQEFKFADCTFN
jgi:hypothetical protein